MTTVCILAFNSTILLSSQQQGSSNVVYIIQDTIIQAPMISLPISSRFALSVKLIISASTLCNLSSYGFENAEL